MVIDSSLLLQSRYCVSAYYQTQIYVDAFGHLLYADNLWTETKI